MSIDGEMRFCGLRQRLKLGNTLDLLGCDPLVMVTSARHSVSWVRPGQYGDKSQSRLGLFLGLRYVQHSTSTFPFFVARSLKL